MYSCTRVYIVLLLTVGENYLQSNHVAFFSDCCLSDIESEVQALNATEITNCYTNQGWWENVF